MRRYLAAVIVAAATVVSAGVTMGGFAPAGAQAFTCTYQVTPTQLAGAGTVQVSGVAPGSTKVEVKVDGVTAATAQSAPVSGVWGPVSVQITTTSTVSVALPDNYATLPCIGNGGTEVVRVSVGGGGNLARTGSSDTRPLALAALAALGVGSVLVVGARRRRTVHARV